MTDLAEAASSTTIRRTPRTPLAPSLVLLGLLLVAGNLRAAITAVGPVLPAIERSLSISSLVASVLVSLPLLTFAIVSPIAPRVAHRIGLEPSIALGLVILTAGLVLRSTPPLAMLWVGTGLIGVSIAVLNVVLPSLVKRDFPTKVGQITGGYSAVQATFAAIAAGTAAPLAGVTALGWRLPLGVWAGLALIALVVLAPQLRRRTVVTDPVEDISLSAPTARPLRWRSPWRSPLGWQITAFMGLQSVVFYTFVTWLPSIEGSVGLAEGAISAHQFLLNAAGILANLVCSALLPRLRDQRVLGIAAPATLSVGTLGLLLAPAGSLVWACLIGFGGGASIVLALSFFGLRTTHHAQAATLSGMAQSIGYLVAAVGPVAFGALHDSTGSWTPALVALLAIQAVLIILGYLCGRSRTV